MQRGLLAGWWATALRGCHFVVHHCPCLMEAWLFLSSCCDNAKCPFYERAKSPPPLSTPPPPQHIQTAYLVWPGPTRWKPIITILDQDSLTFCMQCWRSDNINLSTVPHKLITTVEILLLNMIQIKIKVKKNEANDTLNKIFKFQLVLQHEYMQQYETRN